VRPASWRYGRSIVVLHLVPIVVGILAVFVAVTLVWPYCRPAPFPMEVLLDDWRRRAIVRRQLGGGLRRLRRLVRGRSGVEAALLVVESLPNGKRAECHAARRRGEGGAAQVITVALTTGERRHTADELLAVVAEQYLALVLGARRPRPASTVVAPAATTPDRLRALLTDLGVRDGTAG